MYALELLLRVMHILGAVLLLGGVFFQLFALRPATNGVAEEASCTALRELIRRRGSVMTMLAIALLLISGLVNTARISMDYQLESSYHMLLGVKLLLALFLFAMASLLTGRSNAAQKVRANMSLWLNLSVLAALLLLGVAAAMKLTDREPKSDDAAADVSQAIATQRDIAA